jgi:hypothetical protein
MIAMFRMSSRCSILFILSRGGTRAARAGCGSLRPEYKETLTLGRHGLVSVEGHELQAGWILLGGDDSGSDLERIRGPQGMGLYDPLRLAPDDLRRNDLGPPFPGLEELSTRGEQALRGAGLLTAPAGERGQELDTREGPDHDVGIRPEPSLNAVGGGLSDE